MRKPRTSKTPAEATAAPSAPTEPTAPSIVATPSPTRLLVATHNKGKVREYREILADMPLEVTWLDAEGITLEVEETGATFAENAILKATTYAALSGLLTWADDSGLCVDALGGKPGVFSARYGDAGLDDRGRYELLIHELRSVPPLERTAHFQCTVALALPNGPVYTVEGQLHGRILHQPRGSHGFGYDPVFFVTDEGMALAEIPPARKNQVSHRAVASRLAHDLLARILAGEMGAQEPRTASGPPAPAD